MSAVAQSALSLGSAVGCRHRSRAFTEGPVDNSSDQSDMTVQCLQPNMSHELDKASDRVSLVSTAGSGESRFSGVTVDNDDDDDDDDDTASCGTPVYRMPYPSFDDSEDGDEPATRPRGRSRRVSFDVPEEEEKVVIGRRPRSVEVHDLESLVSSLQA